MLYYLINLWPVDILKRYLFKTKVRFNLLYYFFIPIAIFSCSSANIVNSKNTITDKYWSEFSPANTWDEKVRLAKKVQLGLSINVIKSLFGAPDLSFGQENLYYLEHPDRFGTIRAICFAFENDKLIEFKFCKISQDPW